MDNSAFGVTMKVQTASERYLQKEVERKLKEIGPSEAIDRLLSKYGSTSTKKNYLTAVALFLRWLRVRGIGLTPDQLVKDNLVCIFNSDPTDVHTKRKHTDWLDLFVNGQMLEKGYSESHRRLCAAGVAQLYKRNDSPLFGDFSVSRQPPGEQPKPLTGDDIRQVLKSLPLGVRTPLLLEWQSGMEIGRVLGLVWGKVSEGLESKECPMKLQFGGRKNHRRPYSTFLGVDSVEHLRMWRQKRIELSGRELSPDELVFSGKRETGANAWWLDDQLKAGAAKLFRERLVKNGAAGSWHTHALRHSFSTECAHAEVKPEVREYWMGHLQGISWVYQHPELHEEDLVREYRKVEPFVSLSQTEAILKGEFEEERVSWIKEIQNLKREVAHLAESSLQAGSGAQAT